jgi:hypothetical protein
MISNWGPLYDVCVIIGREDDTPRVPRLLCIVSSLVWCKVKNKNLQQEV